MSFAKDMSSNISENISQTLVSKYSQKPLDHAKQYATDAFKTFSKRVIQNKAEANDDLIGNKIADKINKIAQILQHKII